MLLFPTFKAYIDMVIGEFSSLQPPFASYFLSFTQRQASRKPAGIFSGPSAECRHTGWNIPILVK
jgi:hypothetical protein